MGQNFEMAPVDELLLEELLEEELLELELLEELRPELELLEELLLELELLEDELLLELELLDEDGSATHPLNKIDPNKVRHSADNRGEVRILVFPLLLF